MTDTSEPLTTTIDEAEQVRWGNLLPRDGWLIASNVADSGEVTWDPAESPAFDNLPLALLVTAKRKPVDLDNEAGEALRWWARNNPLTARTEAISPATPDDVRRALIAAIEAESSPVAVKTEGGWL